MPLVLDASIAACWAFPDEDDPRADEALRLLQTESALVPALWWFELRNILVVNERRKRITESGTAAFLLAVSRLRIYVDHLPGEAAVLQLARAHRLSVYDAAYLELALREAAPLATLDDALAKAAAAEGAVILGRG